MSEAHKGKKLKEMGHKINCICPVCNSKILKGSNHLRFIQREERTCQCGCKSVFTCMITSNKRFIIGHNKSQLGRKKTKTEIEKQRNSIKLYYNNLSIKEKEVIKRKYYKSVCQYDLNGIFIKKWLGITYVAEKLNINKGNISACCNKKRKSAGGFIWKYKEIK